MESKLNRRALLQGLAGAGLVGGAAGACEGGAATALDGRASGSLTAPITVSVAFRTSLRLIAVDAGGGSAWEIRVLRSLDYVHAANLAHVPSRECDDLHTSLEVPVVRHGAKVLARHYGALWDPFDRGYFFMLRYITGFIDGSPFAIDTRDTFESSAAYDNACRTLVLLGFTRVSSLDTRIDVERAMMALPRSSSRSF